MPFPVPEQWNRDTAEVQRDERKRVDSPCSFFYSQGRALVLAAQYFSDERLTEEARGGVAAKHRHRIHLALFGQLLASFEYMLKDFVAKVLDSVTLYDEKVRAAKWIEVDATRVLSLRMASTTPGSLLIHPTMGWHYPEDVNRRFTSLFEAAPIATNEIPTLERLWVLRHSVAHNAGFMIAPDAARFGAPNLRERMVAIDAQFIEESFNFLCEIAKRLAETVGGKIVNQWLVSRRALGTNFARDQDLYQRLKKLATYLPSRPTDLTDANEATYQQDYATANPPPP